MHAFTNGYDRSKGTAGTAKPGMRVRWRHSRSVLKEGLEAALRASPEVIENCKPKTNYGVLIRGLILEAAKCKATPLKTMMALIDWRGEDEGDEEMPDEAHRDWSPDGVWETMPEEEPAPASEPVEEDGPNRKELKRRLTRMIEAGQHEHVARIVAAIRASQAGEPEPLSTG